MILSKRVLFGVIYGIVLAAVTLTGLEFLSSFYAPAWPARALRSIPPPAEAGFNSWGMRDKERAITKPAGGPPRVVFVGDSFVEAGFSLLSLPMAVERKAASENEKIEAIDLGISGTDPRSYYYRIRDVALHLSPDALLLFIYAGNDFMAANKGYSIWPSLIDESPGGSILGSVMPRTNWLLVNRLRLSDFLKGNPGPPEESEMLAADLRAPEAEQIDRLVAHVKKYYYPSMSEAKLREVLARGGQRLAHIPDWRAEASETLQGWMLQSIVDWETRDFHVAKDRQDAQRLAKPDIVQATLSWIEASDRLAREHKVPLMVFLSPVGSVDPQYEAFWKVWPRYYSWNYLCENWQSQLAAALVKTRIHFFDLRQDLQGVAGSYRLLDGHWSKKGEEIVVSRVSRELGALLKP